MCPQPGNTFNPYRDLALEHVVQIDGHGYKAAFMWVLDPDEVAQVVAALDADTRVEAYDFDDSAYDDRSAFVTFQFTFAPGLGPRGDTERQQRLDFQGDISRSTVRFGLVELQVPPEFFRRLVLYLSEMSPTPEPSATPTPVIVPRGSVKFAHPDGELEWDGPSPRVLSVFGGHCGSPDLEEEFGIPSLITIEDTKGFWAISPTLRDPSWRWTGYSFEQWELWQGDDAETIYIVTKDDERIAFEYKSFGCI